MESSYVIPAFVGKSTEAAEKGEKQVTDWGTGKASREFLYVEDAAEGIIAATEKYDKPYPVNLGTGNEITIKALVTLVAELTCFEGEIIWDSSRPDGQPRRCLDITRAKREFDFETKTDLTTGLKKTIEWYKKQG